MPDWPKVRATLLELANQNAFSAFQPDPAIAYKYIERFSAKDLATSPAINAALADVAKDFFDRHLKGDFNGIKRNKGLYMGKEKAEAVGKAVVRVVGQALLSSRLGLEIDSADIEASEVQSAGLKE